MKLERSPSRFPLFKPDANNVDEITTLVSGYLQPAAGYLGSSLGSVALGTANTIASLIIILFVSIYITNDAPRLTQWVGDVAEIPGYRYDAERLWRAFGRIWQSYLRGQAILGLVIGLVVYVLMLVLGVENPLALGAHLRPNGIYPLYRTNYWGRCCHLGSRFSRWKHLGTYITTICAPCYGRDGFGATN